MPDLTRETRRELVAALIQVATTAGEAAYPALVRDWPDALRAQVTLVGQPALVIDSLVGTGLKWEPADDNERPPLVLLIENAQDLVHGSGLEARLEAIRQAVAGESGGAGAAVQPRGPFVVAWARNPLFVGRQDELDAVTKLLDANQTPAICGAGGMGKTQLAVELAYHLRARFPGGVFWLTMDPAESIAAQVAALAGPEALNLPGWEPNGFERNLAMVQAAWKENVPRLLIFDNLEDPLLLRDWQPKTGGCRVLITTRRATWATTTGVRPVLLPVLDRAASVELLLTPRARATVQPDAAALLADPATAAAADTLCAELGDLPLALALAAAYLETAQQHKPAADVLTPYLAQIREQMLAHPSLHAGQMEEGLPTGHVPSLQATFALSYDRLTDADPTDARARRLLHRAAQCAPAPIPRPLLVRLAADDPNADPTDEAEDAADTALRRLAALGLIEALAGGTARLHRLLAVYAHARSSDPAADTRAVENALSWELSIINKAGYPLAGVPYLEHLWQAARAAEVREEEDAGLLLNELGYLLKAQGDYGAARPLYERALAIYEQALGPTHPNTAQSLNNLGLLLWTQGDYGTARPLLERALAIHEQARGPTHPATATSLNNLAGLLDALGDYAAARPLYERSLAITEQALGPTHPDTATRLNNLALLLYAQGDYAAARPLYERALAIREQALGPTHPDTAQSLHNLAVLHYTEGDYAAARPLVERAVRIVEQTLGPGHPTTRLYRANLAACLAALARAEGPKLSTDSETD